jgi:hypothetical protein
MQANTYQPSPPPPPTGKRTSLRFTDDAPISLPAAPAQKLQVSCREAVALLGPGWSEYRVRQYVRNGALPGHVIGHRTVIYRQELERWIRGDSKQADLYVSTSDSREQIERKLTAYAPTVDARMEVRLAEIERQQIRQGARIERLIDLLGVNEAGQG